MAEIKGEYCIAASVETDYNVDSEPTAASNGMRVECDLKPHTVDSESLKYDSGQPGSKGAMIVGSAKASGTLSGYLAGSGTATTPPLITVLMKGGGLDVTAAADHVAVTPKEPLASDSLTLKFFRGKIRHDITGWRSSVEITLEKGKLPTIKFTDGKGNATLPEHQDALQSSDLTGFKSPIVCDHVSFVKQEIMGQTEAIEKVVIKITNTIEWVPAMGQFRISDRKVMLDVTIEEPDINRVNYFDKKFDFGAIALQVGQDTVDDGGIFKFDSANAQLQDFDIESATSGSKLTLPFECVPLTRNSDFVMKFQ